MTTQQLIDQVLTLPEEERAIVAESILRSLNAPDPNIVDQWATEAKRRLDEIRSGGASPVPSAKVFERIRERFEP